MLTLSRRTPNNIVEDDQHKTLYEIYAYKKALALVPTHIHGRFALYHCHR